MLAMLSATQHSSVATTITDTTDGRMQLVDNDTVRAFVTPVYALMEMPVLMADMISSS